MHIDIVPNRASAPAVLLRESYREGGKVKKRTLANLSKLPMAQVEAIRAVLRGDRMVPAEQSFEIVASKIHGDSDAVLLAMRRLGLNSLLSDRKSTRLNSSHLRSPAPSRMPSSA